ncbi:SDR family NAD(P)-dependent oxidoreductase [Phormidium sp. CLA17]|uniref:SDR family NAD(P)-dependent oxidoreductase n=1 Tax=Leptolyngbya sp. Cla-17 TaxID=2803751 RepID=UPI0014921431|nr:SDR family NAD(P)-dependent oxidoreductase [Leptolyngbya sp. Cla-17]MBM0743996.1 SDR family NAD(P)-dependent oxidoreductase [Leptolyngbya sp. Cla-17]
MNSSSTRPLAVITGASSGIGYELAKQFAQNGFDLLITSTGSSIDEAAPAFEALGADVKTVQVDLATYEGVETLYDQIKATGRPVEAIAINAGVGVNGAFIQNDLQDELNLINLNIVSSVHLAKRVVKDMVARGNGKVLITASIAALMPGPFYSVYAASKAFLHSFSQGLRNELKDTGVSVTALMPGPTDTNFFDRADMDDTIASVSPKDDPAQVAKQGFEALMAGKDEIIAGSLMTKIMTSVGRVLPETVKAELHGQLIKPESAKN